MNIDKGLTEYFQLHKRYMEMFEEYKKVGVNNILDEKDKEFAKEGDWRLEHYFKVGANALNIIISALLNNKLEPPRTILDFPSGSGRVTRHLKSFFPAANIVVCDLYEDHINFCVDNLGVEGKLSDEFFENIQFDQQFDLIFCGSLLTHLPLNSIRQALALISRSLSDRGIAVVTFHGRHSVYIQDNKWKYVEDELFDIAKSGYEEKGFGYVDYEHDFRSNLFDKQETYGVSLSLPSWVLSELETNDEIRILGYYERFWDQHQDVVIFGKPGVNIDGV